MRDIDFHCCDELIEFVTLEDFTIKEMMDILGIKYCPWCGFKLSRL